MVDNEIDESVLKTLKFNLREEEYPTFSDSELLQMFSACELDVGRTSYFGLLMKSENSEMTLPSGMKVPNQGTYWKDMAKLFRSSMTGYIPRVDGV